MESFVYWFVQSALTVSSLHLRMRRHLASLEQDIKGWNSKQAPRAFCELGMTVEGNSFGQWQIQCEWKCALSIWNVVLCCWQFCWLDGWGSYTYETTTAEDWERLELRVKCLKSWDVCSTVIFNKRRIYVFTRISSNFINICELSCTQ